VTFLTKFILYVGNVSAKLSKRFIIGAGHVSGYMFGNIEYKTKENLLSSKRHSQLDELFI
jgi:hypothetical protein